MIIWNRILVGVDDDDHSLGAVRYTASVLGGSDACQVRLLSVYQPPAEEADPDPGQGAQTAEQGRQRLRECLDRAWEVLVMAGLPADNVSTELVDAGGRTIAETILAQQAQGSYGTIVLGRRGLSKAEEFLFGSVSSDIVHKATHCSVWVVA